MNSEYERYIKNTKKFQFRTMNIDELYTTVNLLFDNTMFKSLLLNKIKNRELLDKNDNNTYVFDIFVNNVIEQARKSI